MEDKELKIVKMGRPKNSVRSVSGMIESFTKRVITPQQLKKLYNQLKPAEQMRFLETVLPYCVSKKVDGGIGADEINKLHQMIMEASKNNSHAKTG